MRFKFALLSSMVLATLLTGCVLAPVSRTYYEPNKLDGTPTPSQSCGYHRAANDGLKRSILNIEIYVFPRYIEGEPLQVNVLIQKGPQEVVLNPKNIQLISSGHSFPPESVMVKDAGPYFYKSIQYRFPAPAAGDMISILPLPEFINERQYGIDVAAFRFSRVTKLDIYYGSINC
jgi:hypothetical protein